MYQAIVNGSDRFEISPELLDEMEVVYDEAGRPKAVIFGFHKFQIDVVGTPGSRQTVIYVEGVPFTIDLQNEVDQQVELLGYNERRNNEHKIILAPMPGHVIRVDAVAGQEVERGMKLITLEAMKMENTVQAPEGGKIKAIFVTEGQTVSKGDQLLEIE